VPVLMLCGVLFMVGLHRAGAVAGKPIWKIQVPAYVGLLFVMSVGLYVVHVLLQQSASQLTDQLIARIVSGVSKSTPTGAPAVSSPPAPQPFAQVIETRFESEHEIIAANGQRTHNTILLIPGEPIGMNTWFANNGTATADHAKGIGGIYLTNDRSEQTENAVTDQFRQKVRDTKIGEGSIQQGGQEEFWFTTKSESPMTADDVQKITDGKEFVYFFISLTWTDPQGDHYIHRCSRLQPQGTGFPQAIWQFCLDFSDHH
jgi:hypothetical protein